VKVHGVLILTLAAIVSGCSPQDNEHLARLARKMGGRVGSWTAGQDANLTRAWGALGNKSEDEPLEVRVLSRIRWDRELADCKIEVLREGAMIELSGSVPNHTAHQRAIELAETTVGVESVADWIEESDQPNKEKE
jgi:osmotically-inducible protein OsmY